jgi:Alpha-2-macroglobulin family
MAAMARVFSLRLAVPLLALLSLALLRSSDAAAPDPAARGLDLFVHAPDQVAPGGTLPIAVEAVGFTSVVTPVRLAHAVVEAAWNPETLGKVSSVPPPVKVTTDGDGRAHLDVPMPDGDEGDLELLLGVRSGQHTRTRALKVHRTRLLDTQLHVPDPYVVPGSTISAWVLVKSASTGEPVGGAPVHVALLEGGVPRFEVRLVTDPAGNAMTRVPIPRSDDPAWSWTLEARALAGGRHHGSSDAVQLFPREETPGKPRLKVAWKQAAVFAGDHVDFVAGVRDAADQPIADLPLRFWIGPRGTQPPKDDEGWLKASTRGLTNAAGEVRGGTDTPSTVVQGAGTTMSLVVKTNVDGHDLEGTSVVQVGTGGASAELFAEAKEIAPGVEQRLLLRVIDGHGRPVAAPFLVEGDGLHADVRTDAWGEAQLTWKAPADVGAARNVGPCAGGVAASVRVRATAEVPQILPRRDPFDLCLSIDREAAGIVRADRSAARAGDTIHVTVTPAQPSGEAKDRALARGPWSVVVQSANDASAASTWIEDGEKGGDLTLPKGAMGTWMLSAAMPGAHRAARVLGSAILVTPRALPRLKVTLAGGRAAPGGAVDVDVALSDEKGQPMVGSIAAVMIDARGGGSTYGVEVLDTRQTLCRPFPVRQDRCDRLVEGDPALDPVRRASLAQQAGKPLAPTFDPGANVTEALRRAFASVLLSLEGAVRDASHDPDQLRDVRRKVGSAWQFNPELMTLVTAAMTAPPETPGGEPLTLGDMMAIDPQVTFDNVARRISRAKLFHVLVAVRQFRRDHRLDPEEPALKNPNAILRRLVREGQLTDQDLVDPWGGTLQFTRTSGAAVPFLGAIHGFELHAPGPDGALGSGDDVRDPFERVLRSSTPYAEAVQEDRVVDAKFEMEVGDATVDAWTELFAGLFGSTLGGSGGLGLSGYGEGGGGRGSGVLTGRLGTVGHGRGTSGVDDGVAFWSPPQRTDERGHLRLHVPLRDLETTWRLAVVGVPDGGTPATAALEIPVALPLSARVDAGAVWVEGDEAAVAITVRNRSAHAVSATLEITASDVASLAEPALPGGLLTRTAEVPAEGAVVVRARVKTAQSGTAQLDVRLRAGGAPDDVVTHRWEVRAPGEPTDFTSARWVEDAADLALTMPPASIRKVGAPRLVLERGWEQALAGALESLDPDEQSSPRAMADTVEVASRLRRWAIARGGETDPLAERAAALARRAVGRLAAYAKIDPGSAATALTRAIPFAPTEDAALLGKPSDCPADGGSRDQRLEALEAEPSPVNGTAKPCWDAFVTDTATDVQSNGDPESLARLLLAVIERPHRQILAVSLADRLREQLALKPSGAIRLADDLAAHRAVRAIVFAALLRAVHVGQPSAADATRLVAWIGVQRDGQGGYGSSGATRAVIRALLAEGPSLNEVSHVTIEGAGPPREIDVPATAHLVLPLPAETTRVALRVKGPGVVARFERPVLRLWSHPPPDAESPLHLEAIWPDEAKAGHSGKLVLRLRQTLGRPLTADLTVPMPAGVTLAEAVNGVRQVQGTLAIRRGLDASLLPTVIEIPLRFALAGRLWAPEARARVAFEEMPRAIAPARPVVVQ